jgi:hypothetical protein
MLPFEIYLNIIENTHEILLSTLIIVSKQFKLIVLGYLKVSYHRIQYYIMNKHNIELEILSNNPLVNFNQDFKTHPWFLKTSYFDLAMDYNKKALKYFSNYPHVNSSSFELLYKLRKFKILDLILSSECELNDDEKQYFILKRQYKIKKYSYLLKQQYILRAIHKRIWINIVNNLDILNIEPKMKELIECCCIKNDFRRAKEILTDIHELPYCCFYYLILKRDNDINQYLMIFDNVKYKNVSIYVSLDKDLSVSSIQQELKNSGENIYIAYKLCYKKGLKYEMNNIFKDIIKDSILCIFMLFEIYFEYHERNEKFFLNDRTDGKEIMLNLINDPRMTSHIKNCHFLTYIYGYYDNEFIISLIDIFEFESWQGEQLFLDALKVNDCCMCVEILKRFKLDTRIVNEAIRGLVNNVKKFKDTSCFFYLTKMIN